MLSMISEHTGLPSISLNVPRNNYGRLVLAVLPMQAERLTSQIPTQPNIKGNMTTDIYLLSIPNTPLVIPH